MGGVLKKNYSRLFSFHIPFNTVETLVSIHSSSMEATNGCHAIIVLTEWDEFKTIDFAALYKTMPKPAHIFDGRLILDHARLKSIGFHVEVIGKVV